MIQPWKTIGTKALGDFKIFSLRSERRISPRNQTEHDVYLLDCPNWVNIIAVTPDDQLVFVEQYRHGSNTVELEIPGGVMDSDETSPVATAVRELREETGYEGENARLLGKILPNPAIQGNTCFTVLIEKCRLLHAVEFDHGEDLTTRLIPLAEVPRLLAEEKIQHALVAVALQHFELWRNGVKRIS